jgi:hypothetical protein
MRLERIGLVGAVAGVVLGGLVAVAGCGGHYDTGGGADAAELHGGFPFHHRHHGQDAGSAGGSAAGTTGGGGTGGSVGVTTTGTGGNVASCDLCTQAQACCDVVESEGPGCTFSAAKCASEPGDALPAYANNCLVFLVTVRGAWGGNPPAECR